jgi:hypothetical protein
MKIIKSMSEYKFLISKALSLTDRNIYSNTYGCVDRNYWHNKDGKGFYISSFQVICLGLSAHYYISKNLLFKNISKSIIEWFINNFFKRKCAEEYYSHQDSYCSLVYNLFAIVGACALIKEKKFDKKIVKIFDIIKKKKSSNAANQNLAYVCANFIYYKSLKNVKNINNYLNTNITEYGGIDTGYLTKMLTTLAWTHSLLSINGQKFPKQLINYTNKIISLLNFYIVKKNVPFNFNARGNNHHVSGGLEYFTKLKCKTTKEINNKLKNNLHNKYTINYKISDDKYFCFFHFNSEILKRFSSKISDKIKPIKYRLIKNINQKKYKIFFNKIDNNELTLNRHGFIKVSNKAKHKIYGMPFFKKNNLLYYLDIYKTIQRKEQIKIFGKIKRFRSYSFLNSLNFRFFLNLIMSNSLFSKIINKIIYVFFKEKEYNYNNLGTVTFKNNKIIWEIKKLPCNEVYYLDYYHPDIGHSSRFYKTP